ncbi:MAG: hypothetical protein PVJ57_03140 [Phycisphaerae bacterium]
MVGLGLLGLPGCAEGQHASSRQPPATQAAGKPMVFLQRIPHYPGVNEEVVGGVVFAVWQDGTFVRCTAPDAIGKTYIKGHLSSEQLQTLTNAVDQTIQSLPANDAIPVDAGGWCLCRRGNGRLVARDVRERTVANPLHPIIALTDQALSLEMADAETLAKPFPMHSEWLE